MIDKLLYIIGLFIALGTLQAQKISGSFNCNNPFDTIFLAENIGGKYQIIDTSLMDSKKQFNFQQNFNTGYYALWHNQNNYAPIIINKEEVYVQLNDTMLRDGISITKSEENKKLWAFIQERKRRKSEIAQAYMHKTDFEKNSAKYLSFDSLENKLKSDYNEYILQLYRNDSTALFTRSILSDIEVENKKSFFKYVDFSDVDLIRTGVFTHKITEYLQFQTEYTEDGFIESIDKILLLASVNNQVYDFVLNYLLELFNEVGPDVILDYLVEEYVIGDACSNLDLNTVLNNKLSAYKRIKIGKKAPNVSIFDINGIMMNLHDLCSFSDLSILYFGSSHCQFCQKANPRILDIMKNNPNRQELQIIYISLDTEMKDWEKSILNKPDNWLSLSELNGWDSKSTKIFQVHKTPTFFILNQQAIIISKPKNIEELNKEIQLLQHKKKTR